MRFRRMERKNETLYRTSPAPYGGTLPKGEGLRLRRQTIIFRKQYSFYHSPQGETFIPYSAALILSIISVYSASVR